MEEQSATVQMDNTGFSELQDQILNRKNEKSSPEQEGKKPSKKETNYSNKKYTFSKGDQSLELDDDFEIEIMADKRPTRMTLRELRERAAGDVAIKNRMHSLAEERKKVQATMKEFAALAKKDPLGALEYISNKAREEDGDFDYSKYVEMLADQAEKFGQMSDPERKAWELEKKLKKTEQDLSQKQREGAIVERKQELLSEYPQIGDSQLSEMVESVLENEDLLGDAEDEHDILDIVEQLIVETLTQKDILTVIKEINPSHMNDEQLIFALSDQLRQNPDLDEEDVRDILREVIGTNERVKTKNAPISERDRDIRTLSNKARQGNSVSTMKSQNMTPYQLLAQQLVESKKTNSRTPLYMR